MDAIGIVGSPRMETWMVDMLFGQPGQAKTDTAAAPPVPAVAVASGARSTVAPGTGQAIAALQAGGVDPASDAEASDRRYMTVDQANAMVASNNAMTSAQISKALYSGKGLRQPGLIGGANETFASMMQRERDNVQWLMSEAEHPSAATEGVDPLRLRKLAEEVIADNESMQKAFDNHSLVIQKLSDVPGLNYVGYETFGGAPDQEPTFGTWTESYDKDAMNTLQSQFTGGKHWGVPTIGGVMVLMTWTDDSLK